jgi:hypothetical protein
MTPQGDTFTQESLHVLEKEGKSKADIQPFQNPVENSTALTSFTNF